MRSAILGLGLLVALGVPAALIAQKEHLLSAGTPMLLDLASRDPRSLIQGDYMRLNYAIANALWHEGESWAADGRIVVRTDAHDVASFVRRDDGTTLAPGERLLRYRHREGHVRIGPDAFFFQEGDADLYSAARYGELRVDGRGDGVLVGLRDATFHPLGRARQ